MTQVMDGASGFAWGHLPLHADAVAAPDWTAPAATTDFELGTPDSGAQHCYPGERPVGSFVVDGDRVLPVRPGTTPSGWRVRTADSPASEQDLDAWLSSIGERPLGARVAVVGYGSNLNPQQAALIGERSSVVVLRGLTIGLATAFCATRRGSDSQFPAGVLAADDRRVEHHGVLLIDPDRLHHLDGKEGQGTYYTRAHVSHPDAPLAIVLEDGSVISGELPVYLQDTERPLALVDDAPVLLTDVHQRDLGGAKPPGRTHHHGFRVEPLDELPALDSRPVPVFAYGTLQPGQAFWPQVADMIDGVEPASIHGHRFETGLGYPGLALDHPDATMIAGTLLHPAAAHRDTVMGRMDRIEGHPTLYTRHLVRIDDGRVAWTYLWNGDLG